jgi:hypothetical protein
MAGGQNLHEIDIRNSRPGTLRERLVEHSSERLRRSTDAADRGQWRVEFIIIAPDYRREAA